MDGIVELVEEFLVWFGLSYVCVEVVEVCVVDLGWWFGGDYCDDFFYVDVDFVVVVVGDCFVFGVWVMNEFRVLIGGWCDWLDKV